MRHSLLTSSSNFGKYLPTEQQPQGSSETRPHQSTSVINFKQNYAHESPFVNCKFDMAGNKLYLLDNKNTLIYLNLLDFSYSTLKSSNNCNKRVDYFTIDGNNGLSLLYASPNSELFRVSFDTKKPVKILNLNMSKILAFERNYLRQMLLVLDYKLLFLYDLTKKLDNSQNKIRSLKAGHNEIFTNACFASNNRFIILAVKNIEIRIVEILGLKTVHQIRLPFAVDNLKIEVSYDSQRIAIYGDCNIVFFIILSEAKGKDYSYQLIEIPFVKSIPQLKYTYQNDILFLGSNQVLYGVLNDRFDRAIPIFNEEYQIRMMGFDISIDCKKMAIVSNRNVYQICYQEGIQKILSKEDAPAKELEYCKNGFKSIREGEKNKAQGPKVIQEVLEEQAQSNQFQYEDEDESEDDSREDSHCKLNLSSALISRKFNSYPAFSETVAPLHPSIHDQKDLPLEKKKLVNYIFMHLNSRYREICLGQTESIIELLIHLHRYVKGDYINCLGLLDFVFSNISEEYDKLDHYALAICPDVIAILEKKFSLSFMEFYRTLLVTICLRYFDEESGKQWPKLINWVMLHHQDKKRLPIFAIAMLKNLVNILGEDQGDWSLLVSPDYGRLSKLGFNFEQVVNTVGRIYNDEMYRHLFVKPSEDMIKISELADTNWEAKRTLADPVEKCSSQAANSDLGFLIIKQDEIKRKLNLIQQNKART